MEVPQTIGSYQVQFPLGFGSSGVVYQVYDKKTNKSYAAKFIPRSSFSDNIDLFHVESELRIIERVKNDNIVQWHQTLYTDKFIVIIMELLTSGTLGSNLKYACYDYKTILRISWEVLNGLHYLHSHNLYHMDIKPDNIAFDNNCHAKLLDLGFIAESKGPLLVSCGTPFFVAPEQLNQETFDGSKADIWSFGVTLHMLATKELPFKFANFDDFVKKSKHIGQYLNIKADGLNGQIIRLCLNPDPKKRPSAQQLLDSNLFDQREVIPDSAFANDKKINIALKHVKSYTGRSSTRPKATIIIPQPKPQRTRSSSHIY